MEGFPLKKTKTGKVGALKPFRPGRVSLSLARILIPCPKELESVKPGKKNIHGYR